MENLITCSDILTDKQNKTLLLYIKKKGEGNLTTNSNSTHAHSHYLAKKLWVLLSNINCLVEICSVYTFLPIWHLPLIARTLSRSPNVYSLKL